MTERREHWDHTYTVKSDTAVSWYQDVPERSLAFIRKAGKGSVIDIGGGASRLVDRLLAENYADLTVLDISDVALGRSKERLGGEAGKVSWIVADITGWRPERQWDIWHDRAVFHFLTDPVATLAVRLRNDFTLETQEAESHPTPFGTTQDFTYAVFKRI
mgnify:CR=1 FL=1